MSPARTPQAYEEQGRRALTAGHGKNSSGKATANNLHMNLENTVSLVTLGCDTIFLTWMHCHEGSLGRLHAE